MKIQRRMREIVAGVAVATSVMFPTLTRGDDIFKGVRGPTNWQLDSRVGYTERTDSEGNEMETTTNNEVIKYWNGDKIGVFGFINIPTYKSIRSEDASSEGFGDLTFGIGPRGRIDLGDTGSLNFLSYVGASLPTGNSESKPALGNDRIDLKTGIFSTYLTPDKKFEIDTSFEYTLAGENSKGVKGLDEIAAGFLVGTQLTEDNLIRVGAGLTSRFRENREGGWDHAYGPRAVIRFSPPKQPWHIEVIGDYDLESKGLSKGFGVMLQLRINF